MTKLNFYKRRPFAIVRRAILKATFCFVIFFSALAIADTGPKPGSPELPLLYKGISPTDTNASDGRLPFCAGLQTIVMTYWGDQEIAHIFDADGNLIKEFEPCHNGSMCSPVNWTGQLPEYWLLNAGAKYGGLFDGQGERVLRFPADGHPDMCSAVLNITGDCRDEIVVWDPYELWVYAQSDNPKSG